MGYRITYEGTGGVRTKTFYQPRRLPLLIGAFLTLFLLLTCAFWPAGKEQLRQIIIPGDPDITQQAVSELVTDLQNGEDFTDSVTAFCREIIRHGKNTD